MSHFKSVLPQVLSWIQNQKTHPWIFLYGDLGAGKTTFTKELLRELEFDSQQIQSPTFLKLLSYSNSRGECALHMDAYRIDDEKEFLRLGLEDYDHIKVGLVEWPDLFVSFLKKYPTFQEALEVKNILEIRLSSDHDLKKIVIKEVQFNNF
jgi:tRNA threonylcarbamoyl adenosine modification protein YjeE